MMRADMHVHTRASDGLFSPEEVVELARRAALDVISVTDHDSVFNTEKLNTLCENSGIKSVSGVEISAYSGNVKVHTLGYGFNLENARFKSFIGELLNSSVSRTEDIIAKLKNCGVNISFEEISAERVSDKTPVHAMHIARAAVKKGYESNPFVFYQKYMMPGRAAFSGICRPTPEQAIEAINGAGGLAVIAHPGRIELNKHDLHSLIIRLAKAGLGGIEAVYSTHTLEETAYFKELAEALGLLVTGGSDTHFAGGNKQIGQPAFYPSEELRQRLKI